MDSHYRTKACAADTALGGSSLGGLVTMYPGLRYPEVFGKLAVVSPSVWWDGRRILRDVATAAASERRARIWLDMGTDEGAYASADARRLRDALVSKGWGLGGDLRYFEAEGAKHTEAAWARRVEPILQFLFPKM